MVSAYEVAMAKDISSRKENEEKAFLKLHSKLVAFLLKRPDLVYNVEIRNHKNDDGTFGICLQFYAREVTKGFKCIDFYFFDSPEMIARKFEAARDFTAGAITSFPMFHGL